jgi:FMN reductase
MAVMLRAVAVSGSLHEPSRTSALVREILAELGRRLPIEPHFVAVHSITGLGGALRREQLSADVEAAVRAVETADVLVAASPVYRGSYTGLFKHLFDLVDQNALVGTPVLVAASGGSDRHALVLEHQFRPLFAFFQSLVLPLGVYARDADFTDHAVTGAGLLASIEQAVTRSVPLIRVARQAGGALPGASDQPLEEV